MAQFPGQTPGAEPLRTFLSELCKVWLVDTFRKVCMTEYSGPAFFFITLQEIMLYYLFHLFSSTRSEGPFSPLRKLNICIQIFPVLFSFGLFSRSIWNIITTGFAYTWILFWKGKCFSNYLNALNCSSKGFTTNKINNFGKFLELDF